VYSLGSTVSATPARVNPGAAQPFRDDLRWWTEGTHAGHEQETVVSIEKIGAVDVEERVRIRAVGLVEVVQPEHVQICGSRDVVRFVRVRVTAL
jgi:hypothetical protein